MITFYNSTKESVQIVNLFLLINVDLGTAPSTGNMCQGGDNTRILRTLVHNIIFRNISIKRRIYAIYSLELVIYLQSQTKMMKFERLTTEW